MAGSRWTGAVVTGLLLLPAPLAAQNDRSTTAEAGRIASRPARDVGAVKTKVPLPLQRAARAPYSLRDTKTCTQLRTAIRRLSGALGVDFDAKTAVSDSKAGSIAKRGGEALADTIVPFRGIVREVSGAAAAQRRLQAATYAGLARRGFLRGIYLTRGCKPAL